MSGRLYKPQPPYSRERTPVPIEYEAGWAPEKLWTFWRQEIYVAPGGKRTPNGLANSLLTILAELYWLRPVLGT